MATATLSVRRIARMVIITAALLAYATITSHDALAAEPCVDGWHYHDGVGIDCGASLGVGSSTWSGGAVTLSNQSIDEISLNAVGNQMCWTPQYDWNTGWETNLDDHSIGHMGSGDLQGPCGPQSYLHSFGGHLWSTAHLHGSTVQVDHPNELQ